MKVSEAISILSNHPPTNKRTREATQIAIKALTYLINDRGGRLDNDSHRLILGADLEDDREKYNLNDWKEGV